MELLQEFASVTWKDLFKPFQFFTEYSNFLQIEVMTDVDPAKYDYNDPDPKDFTDPFDYLMMHHHEYKGLWESRFKMMQGLLETDLELEDV